MICPNGDASSSRLCDEVDDLEKRAYEQTFETLKQAYESPEGFQQRARALVSNISGSIGGDHEFNDAAFKAKEFLQLPLTEEGKYLAWGNLRDHLRRLLEALPGHEKNQ